MKTKLTAEQMELFNQYSIYISEKYKKLAPKSKIITPRK